MNLITELSGSLTTGEHREPRGMVTMLHVEPVPGVHVKVMLGAAGLVVRRADQAAAFPLADLLKLAFEKCPELIAVSKPDSTPGISPIAAEARRMTGAAPAKPLVK